MKNSPGPQGPFADLRRDFPGTENQFYLDVAARGLISRPVRASIDGYLDHRFEGADKAAMFAQTETCRARFARLIGATPDEICLTKNVSDGINAFAAALPWREGDNIVICESLEHPANVFPWRNLAAKTGIELKVVPPEAGRARLDRLVDAIDARTRLLTVSTVSFSPGFRFPVAELGAACRERGVLLLVDAAQSVGVLHTDVNELKVDALATSTQKGLLALYGAGFLYIRREIADTLEPVYLSRAGVAISSAHEAAVGDLGSYRFANGARRFDVGNHNFLASVAVDRSMQTLESVGVRAIEAHACALARRLSDGLLDMGFPVFGGASGADRAHIVAVGNGLVDEHDTMEDTGLSALNDFLSANGVRLTIRRGMLRFSFHLYNDESDVDAVIGLAREWQRRQGRRIRTSRSGSGAS